MKRKTIVFFLTKGTRIPKFISSQDLNAVKKTEEKFIILKIKKADFGPGPACMLVKIPGLALFEWLLILRTFSRFRTFKNVFSGKIGTIAKSVKKIQIVLSI